MRKLLLFAFLIAPFACPRLAMAACTWHLSSSNANKYLSHLSSVAAISVSNVWVVGNYSNGFNLPPETLIEHWNGNRWSVVPSPNLSSVYNELTGVAAVSGSDVWAVGDFSSGSHLHTLIEHWNGSRWSVIPSPNANNSDSVLNGVAAVSASDVWAAGRYRTGSLDHTLIEHWNGSRWNVVPSPNVTNIGNVLNSIAAFSVSNLWAVGSYDTASSTHTLSEHWNGGRWSVVPSLDTHDDTNLLFGVAGLSASNVWAVGTHYNAGTTQSGTLTEHWDGSRWSVVPSPNANGSENNQLLSVAAVSFSNVWAVGYRTSGPPTLTLTEHWDGSRWSVIPSQNANNYFNVLNSVAAANASNVWAVGSYDNASPSQALIEWFHC